MNDLPDPWGEEVPVDVRLFDPFARRYEDVPLVHFVNDQLVTIRGDISHLDRDRIATMMREQIAAPPFQAYRSGTSDARADSFFGVFHNDLGGLSVLIPGAWVEEDWRWRHYILVEDLIFLDSIADLAQALRSAAELVQRASDAGWVYWSHDGGREIMLALPDYLTRKTSS